MEPEQHIYPEARAARPEPILNFEHKSESGLTFEYHSGSFPKPSFHYKHHLESDFSPTAEPQGNRCFISKLQSLVDSIEVECGLDFSDAETACNDDDSSNVATETRNPKEADSNYSLCGYPFYPGEARPTTILESNRILKTGVHHARHVAAPTTTMAFSLLHRIEYDHKDPSSAHPVSKLSPHIEGDRSGPWLYGVANARPGTVPWMDSTPPPMPKICGPDMRVQDAPYEPPRPRLHCKPALHKMLAGDRDAGSFIIGSPDGTSPHIAATCDLRNSKEAHAYFRTHYKRPMPPKRPASPTWTASDFPKLKIEKRNSTGASTSTLTELLQKSCTDHAICVYLRALEQLKSICACTTEEAARSRETVQIVASQLRELEIANPGLEQTLTEVSTAHYTINSASSDASEVQATEKKTQHQTLRRAVEVFLEQCQQVERKAAAVIDELGQTERLRANVIHKLKTENSAGHDTSVMRARELLARVIDSSFLDEELHRLAVNTLARLEELENCHMGTSQSRVAAMIHSVLENYI
ncbi:hypothetical protein CFO_g3596 [Ceratocystis platani]|uniref:Uncharacterized protein n=1 Tax=Ceratocystis fimbriata f. sp. platani TaxID=88771 RepID=A0A0F8DDJ8_CERFI|nr:hypothetical protein CFO_g3596 [Ceratocystis platani]